MSLQHQSGVADSNGNGDGGTGVGGSGDTAAEQGILVVHGRGCGALERVGEGW